MFLYNQFIYHQKIQFQQFRYFYFKILFIIIKSLQQEDNQCNSHGQYIQENDTCNCDLGFDGQYCDNQYCQWDDTHNGFCAGQEAGFCNETSKQCECYSPSLYNNISFVSTGTNCVVDQAFYVSKTPDWVLLGFGIASVLLAGAWLGYKFRHGNKLDQYEKIDEQKEQQQDDKL